MSLNLPWLFKKSTQTLFYHIFEEQKLEKNLESLKLLFFGGNCHLLQEISSKLFSSNGTVRMESVFRIEEILLERMPAKQKKHSHFSFIKIPQKNPVSNENFVNFGFSSFIEIRGVYKNSLQFLITDQFLKRSFDIFEFLLKLQKSKCVISRFWKSSSAIQKNYPFHHKIMQQVFIISNDFFEYLRQYISFSVIEPEFKVLRKSMVQVQSFQQTFKVLGDFIGKVYGLLFLSKESAVILKQIYVLMKHALNFYKIVV